MLRFRLGPVPVSVHFSFLIIALFVLGRLEPLELVAWTLAVFIAVLFHEAGHAFTARAFGVRSVAITLFAFGGATTYPMSTRLSAGRRFVIAAAGSAVGIVVGGLVLLAARAGAFTDVGEVLRVFLNTFVLASLFWGILNWIPILPLDGGQMLHSALDHFIPKRAVVISRVVSVIFGATAIIWALQMGETFLAFFVGFIVFMGLRTPLGPGTQSAEEPSQPDPERGQPDVAIESGPPDADPSDPPPSFPI